MPEPLRGVREKLSGDTTSEYRRGHQQGVRDSFERFKSAVDGFFEELFEEIQENGQPKM